MTSVHGGLPVRTALGFAYAGSVAVAILMAVASLAGILNASSVYPSDALKRAFLPNDVASLVIGIPGLLLPMWLARRGYLIGLLCWPGALFAVLYNYLIYVLAMPVNAAYLVHLALVILSAYLVAGLLASVNSHAVRRELDGMLPERALGGVIAGLGLLFCLRAAGVLFGAVTGHSSVAETDLAVAAADVAIMPAWIGGGVLLWRGHDSGFVAVPALLLQVSLLFASLVALLLVRPLVTEMPFLVGDFIVVAVMGAVCSVPFGMVVVRIVAREHRSPA